MKLVERTKVILFLFFALLISTNIATASLTSPSTPGLVDQNTISISLINIIMLDDILVPIPTAFKPSGNYYQGDFNGDGVVDLFIQGLSSTDKNYIFLGNSSGKYTAISASWLNGYLGVEWTADRVSISVYDYNSDGLADIKVGSSYYYAGYDSFPIAVTSSTSSSGGSGSGGSSGSISQVVQNVTLSSDVVTNIEKLKGGASDYQLVFEVDVSKALQVPVKTNDPYWWQYYRSFWDGQGKFVGTNAGTVNQPGGKFDNGPYLVDSFGTKWATEGWNTVDSNGYPSSNTFYFPSSTFYSTRDLYTSRLKLTGTDIRQAYYQQHIRKRIDDWVPGASSLGPNYYISDAPTSGITMNFQVQLYDKVTYENESASYTGAEGWQYVMAGEVKPSGWAIVPLEPMIVGSADQKVRWIIIKPKGKNLNVRTNAQTCPKPGVIGETPVQGMTPCIIDPELWKEINTSVTVTAEGRCVDSAGYIIKSIAQLTCGKLLAAYGVKTYDSPEQIEYLALSVTLSFGGVIYEEPDYGAAGKFYFVDVDGSYMEISWQQAISWANQYRSVMVNGSLNSVSTALHGAARLSAAKNRPTVLIYMAQGLTYPPILDDNGPTRASLLLLLENTKNTNVSLTCHSWSVHICADIGGRYSNVYLNLINGAQIPGSPIDREYVNDVASSVAQLTIIAGKRDPWSKLGGGVYVDDLSGICYRNCALKDAIISNPNASQKQVDGASHTIDSVFDDGGGQYIFVP